jgi:hypothetical protein
MANYFTELTSYAVMASNNSERMATHHNRRDYFLLNDGYDDESLPTDRLQGFPDPDPDPNLEPDSLLDIPSSEILPSESISQALAESSSSAIPHPQKRQRPAPVTRWMWDYFQITEIDQEWINKKTKKRELKDRDIRCAYINDKTGLQCSWATLDSLRQTSTTNMRRHLEKHAILSPQLHFTASNKTEQPTIVDYMAKNKNLSHQQLLEKNILRWIIKDKHAFTTVESPAFHQIFHDIPGISLPPSSRSTLRRRLVETFKIQRLQLKEELAVTCKSIALSLDIWTSKNHLPILAIIGHWLTEDFKYQEKVLEFTELHGIHSGENLATAVQCTLSELDLESKVIAITGDNASNNEVMASELYHALKESSPEIQFHGVDSYIRCLAHILNLIVKDILRALKSGSTQEAYAVCDSLREGEPITTQTALAKLRILALWISRSPQKRQKWKEICQYMDLPDRFIEYDVETRWNSTYRMLDSGLKAKYQINRFLALQTEIPPFTDNDWQRLSQIHQVLTKFNELTLFISEKRPQISLAIPLYYELHDLLHEGAEIQGAFAGIDHDIAAAMKEGLKKYKKYYTFVDECDTYYTALILDPRVKGDLILGELDDKEAGSLIIEAIRSNIQQRYSKEGESPQPGVSRRSTPETTRNNVESRMLQRLQPPTQPFVSDINRYFDSPRVSIIDTTDPDWLCNWWRIHKDEMPQMAAAARDYLAIPASEVAVERLFNTARDILGVRRFSMKGDTIRMLMLMNDI